MIRNIYTYFVSLNGMFKRIGKKIIQHLLYHTVISINVYIFIRIVYNKIFIIVFCHKHKIFSNIF